MSSPVIDSFESNAQHRPSFSYRDCGLRNDLGFSTLQRGILLADLKEEPFPYLIFDRAFSSEEHRGLLSELPDDRKYKWAQGGGLRGSFPLWRGSLGKDQGTYLGRLSALMLSEEFARLVVSRFGELPDNPRDYLRVAPRLKLVRDKPGYSLGAHVDGPHTSLTMVIYLRIADPSLGIQLYEPRFEVDGHESRHRPMDAFERVAHLPLGVGSGVCIPRANNAFHAVNEGKPIESVRDVLIYSLYWQDGSLTERLKTRLRRTFLSDYGYPLTLESLGAGRVESGT